MYESPIRLIKELETKIIEDQENNIYEAIVSYGIDIDKDMLFRMLYADRKQYEKGYADGQSDAIKHGRWIKTAYGYAKCSACGELNTNDYFNYCPNCGTKMDEVDL